MGGGWGGQRQSDSRRGVSGKTSAGCLGSQCKGPGAGCARGVLKTASRPGVGEPSGGGGAVPGKDTRGAHVRSEVLSGRPREAGHRLGSRVGMGALRQTG